MDAFRRDFGATDDEGNYTITPDESSNIVAILSAGTAAGALFAAPVGDSLGRRLSLLISCAVFSAGGILQVCATNIPMLLVGRYGIILSRPTSRG